MQKIKILNERHNHLNQFILIKHSHSCSHNVFTSLIRVVFGELGLVLCRAHFLETRKLIAFLTVNVNSFIFSTWIYKILIKTVEGSGTHLTRMEFEFIEFSLFIGEETFQLEPK